MDVEQSSFPHRPLLRLSFETVKRVAVCAILLVMPIRTSVVPHTARPSRSISLADQAQVREALKSLDKNIAWTTDVQTRLTEIPAPSFQEEKRAQAVSDLLAAEGLSVHTDKLGNVIGELRGTQDKDVVLLAAHLDTVFPVGTDVKVKREGERLVAPGISDNGTGLAALVAVSRAIHVAKIKPQRTILFAANVGEEGEGNLRGMRALIDAYRPKLRAVIVLDGSGIDHVTTKALPSRRVEVVITGPGGHSWSDFGMVNPINALVRGSVRFINTKVPVTPRTTFNLGQIEGGTSVNSIPHEAKLKVDLRSEGEDEITRMETALRECIAAGVKDEMDNSRERGRGKLEWKVNLIGSRPGGELAADSALLVALRAADDFVGSKSRIERSSTDANIPLSMGIDAIAIGAGGNGGGAHSLQEWYEPAGREAGLKRVLLTLLGVAGLTPENGQ
jgi:acetylornithine deacetylase/succinyl-diaminopimelate desuccinylase-like protein